MEATNVIQPEEYLAEFSSEFINYDLVPFAVSSFLVTLLIMSGAYSGDPEFGLLLSRLGETGTAHMIVWGAAVLIGALLLRSVNEYLFDIICGNLHIRQRSDQSRGPIGNQINASRTIISAAFGSGEFVWIYDPTTPRGHAARDLRMSWERNARLGVQLAIVCIIYLLVLSRDQWWLLLAAAPFMGSVFTLFAAREGAMEFGPRVCEIYDRSVDD